MDMIGFVFRPYLLNTYCATQVSAFSATLSKTESCHSLNSFSEQVVKKQITKTEIKLQISFSKNITRRLVRWNQCGQAKGNVSERG